MNQYPSVIFGRKIIFWQFNNTTKNADSKNQRIGGQLLLNQSKKKQRVNHISDPQMYGKFLVYFICQLVNLFYCNTIKADFNKNVKSWVISVLIVTNPPLFRLIFGWYRRQEASPVRSVIDCNRQPYNHPQLPLPRH